MLISCFGQLVNTAQNEPEQEAETHCSLSVNTILKKDVHEPQGWLAMLTTDNDLSVPKV